TTVYPYTTLFISFQSRLAVGCHAPGAVRLQGADGAPARLRAPAHRLAAAGLRYAPGTAQRGTSAQPAPRRRTSRRRPAGSAPGPQQAGSLPDSAARGRAAGTAAAIAQRPVQLGKYTGTMAIGKLRAAKRLAGA